MSSQPHGVHGHAYLSRQVRQQARVCLAERVTGTSSQEQAANGLCLVHQWHLQRVSRGRAKGGHDVRRL